MTTASELLPRLNAVLNATSAVLLCIGFWAIRSQRRTLHRSCMQGAVAVSALFLVSYTARVLLTGTHRFQGAGWEKVAYLSILVSHMTLAMAALPLVLATLFLALRTRFTSHRRLARWTFPIWMYVSITGVLVYLMLYRGA